MKKLLLLIGLLSPLFVFSQQVGAPLPDWEDGILDIHHISTGRGDAAFMIFPDGTTMLVDAGESTEDSP